MSKVSVTEIYVFGAPGRGWGYVAIAADVVIDMAIPGEYPEQLGALAAAVLAVGRARRFGLIEIWTGAAGPRRAYLFPSATAPSGFEVATSPLQDAVVSGQVPGA